MGTGQTTIHHRLQISITQGGFYNMPVLGDTTRKVDATGQGEGVRSQGGKQQGELRARRAGQRMCWTAALAAMGKVGRFSNHLYTFET